MKDLQVLAQAQAQQDTSITHTCQSTHDMNKETNVNYEGISQWDGEAGKFIDSKFPYTDALYWADRGSEANGDTSGLVNTVTWTRASNAFDSSYSMWGNEGIFPRDMKQGAIGNCWYIAAAAALAEFPDRLDEVVVNESLSPAGIYAFNMYAVGVPITTVMTTSCPFTKETKDGRQ